MPAWIRNLLIAVVTVFTLAGTVVAPIVADTAPAAHAATQIAWQFPVEGGEISSGYGQRKGGFHGGIDVSGQLKSRVVAPAAMTIIWAGPKDGYGTLIRATFVNRPNWEIRVGHCTWESVNRLTPGMQFAGGEQFAELGNEGQSTGPHTHFELYIDGVRVDPSPILSGELGPDTMPDPAINPVNPEQAIIDPLTDLINRGRALLDVSRR